YCCGDARHRARVICARPVGSSFRARRTPQFCNDSAASCARSGLAGKAMEFSTGLGWTRLPLAAAFIFGSVLSAQAQIIPPFSPPPGATAPDDEEAEVAETTPDVNDADVLKG